MAQMLGGRVLMLAGMNMSRFSRLTNEFSKKMENYAAAEGTRLRQSSHGKLRLIGITIGIVVAILASIWMARP